MNQCSAIGHGRRLRISNVTQARQKASDRALSNLEFLVADAELAHLEHGAYDRIMCSSGMLYLQHIEAAVGRFHDWLKPGGQLLFNTPQVHMLLSRCPESSRCLTRHCPQEPCVPATSCFYDLVRDKLGVSLADAAAPLGTSALVDEVLAAAGFAAVTVRLLQPSQALLQQKKEIVTLRLWTCLQVDSTDEVILYKDCDATMYAQRTWNSLSGDAVMTPLHGLVDHGQLQALQQEYLSMVRVMAEPWQSAAGVQNPYVMLWCTATKVAMAPG